ASPAMASAFCGDLGSFAHLRPLLLAQLAQNDVPPERGQMIDEQDAVEMIDLVLDAGGEQALGLELADLVVVVEIAHADGPRPRPRGARCRSRDRARGPRAAAAHRHSARAPKGSPLPRSSARPRPRAARGWPCGRAAASRPPWRGRRR